MEATESMHANPQSRQRFVAAIAQTHAEQLRRLSLNIGRGVGYVSLRWPDAHGDRRATGRIARNGAQVSEPGPTPFATKSSGKQGNSVCRPGDRHTDKYS